jgi:hypothetical protein
MDNATEIDTWNHQFVSLNGANNVVVLRPQQIMTKQEALVHAAWLVAVSAPEDGEFERVLAAVQNG